MAFIYATPDAKSADFVAQLAEARVVHGAFGCNDLMSVLIGVNDVIDLFETVYLADPTTSTANAVANELSARGTRLGQAIAALTANNGPNIIVSTIPRMNLTPYGRQQAALRPGLNVPNVLNQFSNAFNTALRTNIPNDGSRWGLVELDAIVNAAINNPDSYGLDNVRDAVCADGPAGLQQRAPPIWCPAATPTPGCGPAIAGSAGGRIRGWATLPAPGRRTTPSAAPRACAGSAIASRSPAW